MIAVSGPPNPNTVFSFRTGVVPGRVEFEVALTLLGHCDTFHLASGQAGFSCLLDAIFKGKRTGYIARIHAA